MNENFVSIDSLSEKELVPGFWARMIHMEGMSIAHIRIEKDAVLPEHFHFHEQITNVLQGELEFTVAGETRLCKAGDAIVLPSNVPHSVRALTDCKVIDVFQPVREDYR